MDSLLSDNRNELINQIIELLDGCNPIELLSQLTFQMKLAMFFKQTSSEHEIPYDEKDQGNLVGLDDETMFKKISYIQRVLFSGKVKHGQNQMNMKEILNVVDQLLFNHIGQETVGESAPIHANRFIVTHNIHPHLIVEYTKLINKYFFEDEDLEEINDFVEEFYKRETHLQLDEIKDQGIEEYFEIKKKYSFLPIYEVIEEDLNLNKRYINSIVKYEDRYYVFQPNITFDSYYETLRKIYLFKNENDYSKFNKLQQKMSEEASVELLSKLSPYSNSYMNVDYKTNTGNENLRNTCEIDFVLEAGDTLFLGEVKGARLFTGDYNGDPKAFESNVEELLQKPYEQAKRFYEELKTNKTVPVKDKIIRFSDYKTFVFINVTTDYLDDIAIQYSNTTTTNEYLVWNLSLSDLHQYTYLFDHQADFLNFLHQRKKMVESYPCVKYQDEFIFYGLYVKYNDMSTIFPNDSKFPCENVLFSLDEFLNPSNIHISEVMAFGKAVELPQYERMSDPLKQIIQCTKNCNCNETIETIRLLLEFSGDLEQGFLKIIDLKWDRILRNTTDRKITEGPVFASSYKLDDNKDIFTLFSMKKLPQKLPQSMNKKLSIRLGTHAKVNLLEMNSKKEIIDFKSYVLTYGDKSHEKSIYDLEHCAYNERTGYKVVKEMEKLKSLNNK